jgi:aryl-alcohol dehydrogenase-like predicted oxidoreductase
MRYKLLGKSGLRVSELALGTMTFGEDWGWGASKDVSLKIFNEYVNAGGNFIDISVNYTNGTAESFVGDFAASDRDHFVLATKYTLQRRRNDPNFGGNHRKNMMRSVETSLKRLQTDYIDLYWLHAWDFTTSIDEIMRGLDDLIRQGKVLYIGVSDSPAWVISASNIMADLRGWSQFVALQIRYNLADRAVERDLLPMAKAFGLAVTPWSILGAGMLTGKYNSASDEPKRNQKASEKHLGVAETVMAVAQEIGRTPSQVAINWVRQQTAKALPIIPVLGARSEAQIKDNLASLDFELTPEQVKRLTDSSPIDLGFPHDFLASDGVHDIIFAGTYSQIDNHHT